MNGNFENTFLALQLRILWIIKIISNEIVNIKLQILISIINRPYYLSW